MPAVRSSARPQAHLRRFAFWNSHVRQLKKHVFEQKQSGRGQKTEIVNQFNDLTIKRFSASTSTYPARSNPICAPGLAAQFRLALSCKLGRRRDRNADAQADSAKGPRA
jgi:hypothetical protein